MVTVKDGGGAVHRTNNLGNFAKMRMARVVLVLSAAAALAASAVPSVSGTPAGKPAPVNTAPLADSEDAADSHETPEPAPLAKSPPPSWTPAEIADAQSRCTAILKRIKAVAIAHAPIREGECGAPAPIELVSIGSNPEVALSPPAIVTCELAEGLYTWLKGDIQPLAKQHLGTEIIKIETMSDYACRNAYGRKGNKLSEHGKANAIDIRGFVTANAKTAYVLENWGKPQREIREEIAVARAAAERAAAAKLAADKAAEAAKFAQKGQPKPSAGQPPQPAVAAATLATQPANVVAPNVAALAKSTIIESTSKFALTPPGAQTARNSSSTFTLAPDKLGGPNGGKSSVVRMDEFLHAAHDSACRIFGTTLGPEANEAHRNHLHVDMAERKLTKICE